MTARSQVLVERSEGEGRKLLSSLVMAWAQDAETGQPRYILELDSKHRGAKSGCVCVGCGEPLTAVNAAKTEFLLRPHFRHPEGVGRDDCLVLAARAAAMRQFQEQGWLELPRRRMSARVAGLSGEFYDAWVERPAEKLRIAQVSYRDRAAAIFTFDDGRQARVHLTGSPGPTGSTYDNDGGASILITVDDPEIAAMEPGEVLNRVELLPESLCWRQHWTDGEMMNEARQSAIREAARYLDQVPHGLELPDDMDPALKRESVLHFEAKRILGEEGQVTVPGYELKVSAPNAPEPLSRSWTLEPDVLALELIEFEEHFGDVVPDVSCKAYPVDGGRVYWPAFIEITVSNGIDDERHARILAKGYLALEIDLSRAGGRVTREELRRLIVDEVATKRWLHHPEVEEQRTALRMQLEALVQRKTKVLATPIDEIFREYLESLARWLREGKDVDGGEQPSKPLVERPLGEALANAIDKMAMHGYPEAGDSDLIYPHGILDRILSIKQDEGVGYRLATGHGVLNAIRQDRGRDRSFHSLYFIAALAFTPQLTASQREWLEVWRTQVRDSVRTGDATFVREPVYDRLLGMLFPEMADALAKAGAKRSTDSRPQRWRQSDSDTGRRQAMILEHQPRTDGANWSLQDTGPTDWWLKGRDFEQWKRQNPEWAKFWAPDSEKP